MVTQVKLWSTILSVDSLNWKEQPNYYTARWKKLPLYLNFILFFSNLTIPAYDVVVDPVDLMWFVFHLHFCGFIGLIRIKKWKREEAVNLV